MRERELLELTALLRETLSRLQALEAKDRPA
jgi:hypothetical protein